MGKKTVIIFGLLTIVACVQHDNDSQHLFSTSQREKVEVIYAKGFEIEYSKAFIKITSHSIHENTFFADSAFVLLKEMPKTFTTERKIIPGKWKSICCQSSTHLSFLNLLEQLQLVTGLCGKQYVNGGEIQNQLEENEIAEICIGEATQTESILAQNPDFYFTYPFSSEQNEMLEKQGVQTFMIAEYLERNPIARLEWIKLFGVLFNQEELAIDYFTEVEQSYNKLKVNRIETSKSFIMNLPYGDTWYAPSANSLIVSLIEDAGLSYYFESESGTENIAHPSEEIWDIGTNVDYWIIIADRAENYSLEDLIAENEVYGTFKSVKKKQLIFCNTSKTDYFIQGVVEPDVMLKDILYATGQIEEHKPVYFHLLN